MNIGDMGVPFIYQGEELIYPNPVKDGLVLWYDFSGMTNDDESKGIAKDLSGNGNHGTLQNFNFTPESGYDKNKLLFDSTDDYITLTNFPPYNKFTILMTLEVDNTGENVQMFLGGNPETIYIRKMGINLEGSTPSTTGQQINKVYNVFGDSEKTLVNVGVRLDYTKGTQDLLVNGEIKASFDVGINPEQTFGLYRIGKWTQLSYTSLLGSIQSMQVYNRPLTPEEIAHNYAIEKERFDIE